MSLPIINRIEIAYQKFLKKANLYEAKMTPEQRSNYRFFFYAGFAGCFEVFTVDMLNETNNSTDREAFVNALKNEMIESVTYVGIK